MKYYKETFEGETDLLEVDDEGCVWRQIRLSEKTPEIITSNKRYPQIHYPLTDQPFQRTYSPVNISKTEFESYWQKGNQDLIKQWEAVKEIYTIGSLVKCQIEGSFPHGVVCSNHEGQTFVMRHEIYEKKYDYLNLVRSKLFGKVVEYDDENLWIVLDIE